VAALRRVAAAPRITLHGVGPTRFATAQPLDEQDLAAAPVRLPRPHALEAPLDVRPKQQKALATLGIEDVGTLLEHLPDDRRQARPIADLPLGETVTVVAEVRTIASRPVRRRGMRPLVTATVADASGTMPVTFFNQPWLERKYRPGTRLMLTGQLERRGFKVSHHAETREATASAEGVAHYPASEGINSTEIVALIHEHRPSLADVVDPLPSRRHRPDRAGALGAVHFPADEAQAEAGRRRLAYEELLLTQLVLLLRRARRRESGRAPVLDAPRELTARWLGGGLPFTPTEDQLTAMDEIEGDLATPVPMQRLLMGEVGSGKTVVALFALLRAVEQARQGALMAPTETLAEQHFRTLQALLPGELVPVALLTGSTPGRRRADVLAKLASGELSLVVGTHALVEDAVAFADLAVAVVDEQHRFGVRQRAALDAKAPAGMRPHVLHMTATPIPRTLALTAYGDLDVTALKSLPRGRQPIATHVASTEGERARAYERIREELDAGRQAFVVCPLVAESEALQARAAEVEHERLRTGELRDYRVALLHGQMATKEKQAAMESFAAGEADVLVATTVIEVGIDVPNATVMLVEDAERYGISQLHQLRGRIGRGAHASLCILFGPKETRRLQALAEHTDGFTLAEIDLELRGEGELIGVRQSGLQGFKVARLPEDADLLERAQADGKDILGSDPALAAPEHALLADALVRRYREAAQAPIPA
jgi:ATP-dependent DNA helicase RecG